MYHLSILKLSVEKLGFSDLSSRDRHLMRTGKVFVVIRRFLRRRMIDIDIFGTVLCQCWPPLRLCQLCCLRDWLSRFVFLDISLNKFEIDMVYFLETGAVSSDDCYALVDREVLDQELLQRRFWVMKAVRIMEGIPA